MKKYLFLLLAFLFYNFLFSQDINLPAITTYIDSPMVEQKQVLTSEEIAALNVADLPSLLVWAGVQILSYGPYGLEQKPSIRGFTDETVRVVIDGVCVNNAQYGTFDFTSINLEQIEKIEIVRGGFTEGVSDEGAVGGVIYITTKKQSLGHHFSFDTKLASYFNMNYPLDTVSQSAAYNGQLSDNSFLKANGKITFAHNEYLFPTDKGKIMQRDNARVFDGNAGINFQQFFGNGNSVSVNEMFYGGNKKIPGPKFNQNIGKQKDYDNNLTVQLIQPSVKDCLRFEHAAAWLSNNRFYDDDSGNSKHFVNTVKYAGSVLFYKLDWLRQSAGLTLDYTHLNSTDDGLHDQFGGALKSTSKFEFGIFRLSIPLSVNFCNKNFAFTPKLGFGIETEYINAFIDGYGMTQFPNMDDLYWESNGFKGNPNLKPENGWGGDLTVNVKNIWLPFSISVFSNYYENKIQWAGGTFGWMPQNVASAFYLGVDAGFEKLFWNDRICIKGNGEYLYTRLLDKNNELTYGKKIMWTPDFTASLTGGIKVPLGKDGPEAFFTLDANYMGKRYTSNINTSYLKPYFLLNFGGEIAFSAKNWKYTPYFRLNNLLDQAYESVTDYPMPGINLSIGVKISC